MEYRYIDLKSGKPMQVEVPADQYEKAVESMQRRITKGQVPGVTDPAAAKDLVRKSKLTYTQARNLAKAGTFESITYDAATGIVTCTFAAGISSLVSFGLVFWKTKDRKKAQDAAVGTAIQVFGPSFAANMISNQIARTQLSNSLIPLTDKIAETLGPKMVQDLVNAKRALLGQSKISGASASKSFSKALRSTAISEGVMIVLFSVPDTYRVIAKKISGAQYTKNMVSLLASFGGNIAGTYATGLATAKVGEKLGKKIDKRAGAVIGFAGGLVGGSVVGLTVRSLMGLFKEDDSVITARLVNATIANMTMDYMLTEQEMDNLISELDKDSKKLIKFQQSLLKSEHQYYDIEKYLEPYFEKAIVDRETIKDEEVFGSFLQPSFA